MKGNESEFPVSVLNTSFVKHAELQGGNGSGFFIWSCTNFVVEKLLTFHSWKEGITQKTIKTSLLPKHDIPGVTAKAHSEQY